VGRSLHSHDAGQTNIYIYIYIYINSGLDRWRPWAQAGPRNNHYVPLGRRGPGTGRGAGEPRLRQWPGPTVQEEETRRFVLSMPGDVMANGPGRARGSRGFISDGTMKYRHFVQVSSEYQ
jgi:hypothetical protein